MTELKTRITCIQKYDLIFSFCDVDTCVEQRCNQRERERERVQIYGGALGSLNSSKNCSSPKFKNLYSLQTPTWLTHNASFHWIWLLQRLNHFFVFHWPQFNYTHCLFSISYCFTPPYYVFSDNHSLFSPRSDISFKTSFVFNHTCSSSWYSAKVKRSKI